MMYPDTGTVQWRKLTLSFGHILTFTFKAAMRNMFVTSDAEFPPKEKGSWLLFSGAGPSFYDA